MHSRTHRLPVNTRPSLRGASFFTPVRKSGANPLVRGATPWSPLSMRAVKSRCELLFFRQRYPSTKDFFTPQSVLKLHSRGQRHLARRLGGRELPGRRVQVHSRGIPLQRGSHGVE